MRLDADTFCAAFPVYEILAVAYLARCLLSFLMQWRAAAATPPSSGRELPATADRRISASAAAVQPEWTRSASRYAPGGEGRRFPCSNGCAHKSSEGRLSIRNSCSWQASSRRKSFFAWQIRGRGRISSRNGSEGPLYGQNFSRPVIAVTCASIAALTRVNLKTPLDLPLRRGALDNSFLYPMLVLAR